MASTPITIDKLQTFIEAVEFAADTTEWVPSPRQWEKIRDMINNLTPNPSPAAPAPIVSTPMPMPPQVFSQYPQYPPAPVGHTGLGDFSHMPPTAPPPMITGGGNGILNGASSVRTPDIDTSQGKPYTPAFV